MNYNNDYELSEYASGRQWDVSAAFPVLMRKVYVWMTLALVITGITAYGVANSPGVLQAIYNNQILFWGLIIAEFALVIGVSAAINKLSLSVATLMFVAYSVINGALLSYIFLAYTSELYCYCVLHHGRNLCGNGYRRLYHQDRPVVHG